MENTTALLNLSTFYQTVNSSRPSSPFLQPSQISSTPSSSNTTTSSSSIPPPAAAADPAISPNVAYVAAELAIAVLSIVGNLLVCAAVGLNRRLRTVTNYFLVSLAVADVCVGAVAIPCAILTDVGLPRHDLYLCLLMLSVLIMFTQSSIFSLLAVAAERYVAIFMPLRYQAVMTPRNAALVILATWLLAFLIGLVPLMGWHKAPPADSGRCFFLSVVDMTYMVYFNFFACVLTPLVIMFLVYAKIFVAVKRQAKRIAAERGGGEEGGQTRAAAASVRREMKTATSLFLVLFVFAGCWIPLHVINCFQLLCPRCPVPLELLLAAIILSHANSAVNPFLYAYTMTAFRGTFKAIFMCRSAGDGEALNAVGGDDREGAAAHRR